jgi:ribose 1,5-bisphosphokinase PhnN
VIVGQQSAGKSSLLQSLTDIPFTVGGRLCTRFATRIISRRTDPGTSELINVSIEAGDNDLFGYQENKGATGNFNRALPSMTSKVFEAVVEEVGLNF